MPSLSPPTTTSSSLSTVRSTTPTRRFQQRRHHGCSVRSCSLLTTTTLVLTFRWILIVAHAAAATIAAVNTGIQIAGTLGETLNDDSTSTDSSSSSFSLPWLWLWLWQWWCYSVIRLVGACLFLSVAYATGWLHRFVWWIAEHEASKLCNHTPVTIGSLSIDVWRGRYAASNVIIHAPSSVAYHWSSPIVARVGHVHVETNVIFCLASQLWILLVVSPLSLLVRGSGDDDDDDKTMEPLPLELYTVHVSDVQVFVERQHNVYNFLLLDPHVILVPSPVAPVPSSSSVPPSTKGTKLDASHNSPTNDAPPLDPPPTLSVAHTTTSHNPNATIGTAGMTSTIIHPNDDSHYRDPCDNDETDAFDATTIAGGGGSSLKEQPPPPPLKLGLDEEPVSVATTVTAEPPLAPPPPSTMVAQQVVDQIVHAVRQAAHQSGGNPVQVWEECRHSLAAQLKQWRAASSSAVSSMTTTTTGSTVPTSPSNTATSTSTMQQGLSVLKHVTAHLTATTTQAHSVLVPERRKGNKIVYCRIGRVCIGNVRIFVRDNNTSSVTSTTSRHEASRGATKHHETSDTASLGWKRPIVIHRVVIRPHEFCPPRTVSDHHPPQWFNPTTTATTCRRPHNQTNGHANNEVGPDEDRFHDDDILDESLSSVHLPALYQPLPQCIDVIIQRLLAEVAKSNTGRLFQTALGEMADVLATASQTAAAATAAATTSSSTTFTHT